MESIFDDYVRMLCREIDETYSDYRGMEVKSIFGQNIRQNIFKV